MEKDNNLFKITLLVSLILHALIFLPVLKFPKKVKNSEAPFLLNYLAINIPQVKNKAQLNRKNLSKKTYSSIKTKKKKVKLKKKYDIAKKKDLARKLESNSAQKKEIVTKNNPAIQKPDKKLAEDKNYLSYYNLINEQLRNSVIFPDNFSEGEIALTFILTSDGSLQHIEIVKDTSYNNDSLRQTAMEIVENASPFPPFPKELQQRQLTFNVVFCFRERS